MSETKTRKKTAVASQDGLIPVHFVGEVVFSGPAKRKNIEAGKQTQSYEKKY
jgi:hypothetical protein